MKKTTPQTPEKAETTQTTGFVVAEEYRRVLDNSLDIICQIDADGNFVTVSHAALKVWGYEPEELIGTSYWNIVHPDDEAKTIYATNNTKAGKPTSTFENRTLRKDGSVAYMMWSGNWSEEHQIMYCVARDVSELRLAETALEESETNYRALIESLPAIVYLSEPFQPYASKYISPNAEAFGYSVKEWAGRPDMWISLIHTDDRERVLVEASQAIESGTETELEYRMVTHDGQIHWMRDKGQLIPDPEGIVNGWQRVITDVTDRTLAEAKNLGEQQDNEATLRDSEGRLRAIFENSPECIKLVSGKGELLEMNPAGLAMIEADSLEQVQGADIYGVVAAEDRNAFVSLNERVFKGESGTLEYDIVGLKGTRRTLCTEAVPFRNDRGEVEAVLGITRDITANKQAEAELSKSREHMERAQKVARLGSWEMDLLTRDLIWSAETYRIFENDADSFRPTYLGFLRLVHPDDRAAVAKAVVESTEKHSSCSIKHRLLMPDGRIKFIRERWEILRDADGVPVTAVGTCHDITARTLAEASQQESEERLRLLFEQMKDGFYYSSPEGQLLDVNPAMLQMFGYSTREEMLNVDVARDLYFSPEERKSQNLDDGKDESEVYRMRRKDGTAIWVEDRGEYKYDEEGNVAFHQGLLRDVTERKLAEEKLIQSEEKYRDLVENAYDIIYTRDMDGNITSMNAAGVELFGYSQEEFPQLNMSQIVAPEELGRAKELTALKLAGAEGSSYEMDNLTKDGRRITLEVNTTLIYRDGVAVGVQGIGRDITERKRADAALSELRRELELMMETMEEGVHRIDPEGNIIFENPAAARMLGWEASELLGRPSHLTIHHTKADGTRYPREECPIYASSHDGTFRQVADEVFWRQDGTSFPVEYSTNPMRNDQNEIVGSLVTFRDITERKRVENQLIESEAHKGAILKSALDCIIAMNSEGLITEFNPAAEKLFGYSRANVIGKELAELIVPPDLRERHRLGMQHYFATGEGPMIGKRTEISAMRSDGSELPVELAINTIELGGSTAFTAYIRDISERKLAEERLIQSEQQYRDLVENAHDIIYSLDLNGNFTSLNEAGERITGYTPEEFKKMNFSEIVAIEHLDHGNKMMEDRLRGVDRTSYEIDIIAKDGRQISLEVSSKLALHGGIPVGFQGIARDISERKAGEAARLSAELKYQSLFKLAPVGIYQSQADGSVTTANATLAKMLGYETADDLLEKNLADIYFNPEERGELLDKYEERGIATDIDVQWRRKDGSPIWIQLTAHAIKRSDGVTEYFEGFVRDITQQKSDEENLRESDEKFHQLADNINDAFWIRSPDLNKIYFISPAFEKIWGRTVEQVNAEPTEWLKYILPEDRELVGKAYEDLMQSGATMDIEYRILRPDGEVRWVRTRGFQVFDDTGKVIRLAGTVTDTTERRHISEALRESEERNRELVENAIDIIYTHDLKGNYTSVNNAVERIAGFTVDEALAMNIADTVAPEYLAKATQMIAEKLAGNDITAYEIELIAKNGQRVWLEVNTRITFENGVPAGVQGIARDISERKRTEAALKESEFRYHSLFENMLEGYAYCETIFEGDKLKDFVYLEVNGAFETLTGLTDVVGKKISELIPELAETNPDVFEIYGRVALTGIPERCEIYIAPLKRWLSITLYSSDRNHFVGVFDNTTERKRAQSLLKESQEQLALAAQSAKLGIWDWNIVDNKMEWDSRMYELYGIRAEEFSGAYDAWQKGLHPDDKKSGDDNINAALADERPFSNEFRVVWPNGEIHNIEARALVKRDSDGSPIRMIGVNWDITERKTLEEQYRQSQKMEAVGVLAGGIAHDFNNLLTAINGFSDLTLRRMEADNPFRRNIQEVKNAGTRAAELTGQLLAFSRKQVLKPSVINLNSVISNIEKMLRRIIRESVELRVILDPQLGNVMADPGQVEQVIMNLAINARDAMPNGGNLTVETENIYLDEEYTNQQITVSQGEFVRITVSDNGIGMDESTQSHIFEPFFTTKEVGKGTGLGLATVYGIVKQSGGTIMVYTELGHGTSFKVYLPRVDKAIDRPRWLDKDGSDHVGTETILLVEDEDAVRSFVTEVLENSGYTVLSASNGPDALALCQDYQKPIHLLVSDVIMPKMGGAELKKHVVKLLPEVKVLFISGYTDYSIADRGIDDLNIAFLEKPFSPDSLIRKVRDVLDTL